MTQGAIADRRPPDRTAYWQGLDSGRLLLMASAAMLVTASFANAFLRAADIYWKPALAFGGFIAFGELLRLELPGKREAAPIASVGALSYALLFSSPGRALLLSPPGKNVQMPSALLVVAVSAAGMTLGAIPHIAAGRRVGITGMCTRLVAVTCVAYLFRALVSAGFVRRSWMLALVVIVFVLLLGWLVDTLVSALIRADDVGARFSVAIADEMRLQWALGTAVGASVVIVVFGAQIMGLAELAVFIGPLLVTQLAFRRYAGIRATYLQTVRSLARVTEVAGYVEAGHSERVSMLAVSVGRGLGMSERELLALEYAALMHDIGQLSLREPIPGGATLLVSAPDAERIAELGADVIRQAGVLDDVAELVRSQSWPALGRNPEPPRGSKIIKAANAFDDMVGGSADRSRAAAALDRLRQDPLEYDAQVVAKLAEVASRKLRQPTWR